MCECMCICVCVFMFVHVVRKYMETSYCIFSVHKLNAMTHIAHNNLIVYFKLQNSNYRVRTERLLEEVVAIV